MTDYWQYEMGEIVEKISFSNVTLNLCVSEKRAHKNPFKVTFPFILKEIDSEVFISLPDPEVIRSLNLSGTFDQEILFKRLSEHFSDSKVLNVNRYISQNGEMLDKSIDYEVCSEQVLDKLVKRSLFDIQTLSELSREKRLFIETQDSVPVSLGLITRLDSKYAEVSLATFKQYRQKGYARSLALKMLSFIQSEGKQMIWVCEKENLASNAITESMKLIYVGEEKLGYRINF